MSGEVPINRSPPHADSTSKPSAEIVHATHGRLRLKIPGARNNPGLLHKIRAAFDDQPGIDVIEVNPASCCLIIFYDPEHHQDVQSLLACLHESAAVTATPSAAARWRRPPTFAFDDIIPAIEEEGEFLAAHSGIATSIVDTVKALDRQIKRSTGNNIDLEILAPVGLATFTFLEIGAAAATPIWVTLMLFSINHFVQLHSGDADKT